MWSAFLGVETSKHLGAFPSCSLHKGEDVFQPVKALSASEGKGASHIADVIATFS